MPMQRCFLSTHSNTDGISSVLLAAIITLRSCYIHTYFEYNAITLCMNIKLHLQLVAVQIWSLIVSFSYKVMS